MMDALHGGPTDTCEVVVSDGGEQGSMFIGKVLLSRGAYLGIDPGKIVIVAQREEKAGHGRIVSEPSRKGQKGAPASRNMPVRTDADTFGQKVGMFQGILSWLSIPYRSSTPQQRRKSVFDGGSGQISDRNRGGRYRVGHKPASRADLLVG